MLGALKLSRHSLLRGAALRQRVARCTLRSSSNAASSALLSRKEPAPNELAKFKKGEVLHGFVVDEVSSIDELFLTAVRLTHLSTGAQYLHLARDDANNVFSIGFRTTPTDSTGLPHILEHTTLCGSERYPCRDPFFKMLRRSLATFMNAMTGPDYTIYPFSTQNLKDYRNLQSVYLDSVFKPNLRELDFRQEGWRLEHTDVNDKSSPIVFKGVVFNEMKGVFNDNQAVMAERLLNSILPSHTYSVISGGDPLVIPNLQHDDLVNFHRKYYHPSNSRFYSYGNFPLEDHLKFINDRYLFLSDRIDASMSEVPAEKRWSEARDEHIACKPDPLLADPSRNGAIAIAHLCNDITDLQTTFEMYVLSQLLLKGPNSAFYKSLVESNISTGFGSITGFDPQCRDTMFVVSLQGVKPEDFGKVKSIFDNTVQKVVEEGFEKDHVEAVLHSIELQVKHQTSNFGLNLLFNLTSTWNHNGDLIKSLRINDMVQKFTSRMREDPKYLQSLIETYLSDNPHRLTLTMTPDEKYEQNKALAEQELLRTKLEKLSAEERERIYENGKILLAEQQSVEDVGVLPTLKVEDLKADVERYETSDSEVSGVPLQVSVQPTNGISYYRGILNTQALPSELKQLVPLFNYVVARMGTQNHDYRSFDQMMELKTGGLHFANHIAEQKDSELKYEEGIVVDSYCLDRNSNDMWKLWTELFNNVKLTDLQRFETLVKMKAADLINGISQSGHLYAMSSAASLISPIARAKESLSGLQYITRMKKVAQIRDLTPLMHNMQEIADHVLNKERLRSVINLSAEHRDDVLGGIHAFYDSLRGRSENPHVITSERSIDAKECGNHYVLPYTVNYCSKAVLTVPYSNPDYAALRVLSKLISSVYLHSEIREKGGAYGGGAKLTSEGIFSFYSYRDPNSTRTFDLFDGTYDFLVAYSLPQSDIDEAKLGIFQQIDAPVPPSSRGLTRFLYGITDDDLQRQRKQVKAVTKEQLLRVAEKYLKPDQSDVRVGRSLIGPTNPDLSSRHKENWLVMNQEEADRARASD
ncbi:PREDICTED: presequence protease, mitochondrial [Vollenhovia emeryi]|uniref:presequence protease, mitochondrial n=1 Tax=Vollenhovia emeryi TaxID=411798 RepID=UPI0005F5162C|nr:PREDICTED: presequence protease, mitochondrial [Vollenhovia emeryi]XP_011861450.1 PREDICTED: presequence protease, mitochondrial [Vollenhovia emeryi]